jgi:beta-N-acetylhexosaminidase
MGSLIAVIVLIIGALSAAPTARHRRHIAVAPRSPRLTASRPGAAARAAVPALSPAQLAGQRVIYAYSGLTPPPALLAAIRAGEAAGVILFSDNVASSAQALAATQQLAAANAGSPVHAPLLILTDQEGGQVRRLPGAPELSEREIGQSSDAQAVAAQAGTGAGQTLAAAGLNANLAPVLDVAHERGNFIDAFERSYGSDPRLVAQLGHAFIGAQQRLGVAATAKHFPGLGAAASDQNTDSEPVTLNVPLATLRAVDEAPFRSAIEAGVKLVMTSWAVYPALDPSLPAGLSPRVIQGELRGRLGFRGVTISDTLSAGALQAFGTLAQRGVLAAKAGADLLICAAVNGGDDPSAGLSVLNALQAAIAGGQITRSAARQAAARVLALRMSVRGPSHS